MLRLARAARDPDVGSRLRPGAGPLGRGDPPGLAGRIGIPGPVHQAGGAARRVRCPSPTAGLRATGSAAPPARWTGTAESSLRRRSWTPSWRESRRDSAAGVEPGPCASAIALRRCRADRLDVLHTAAPLRLSAIAGRAVGLSCSSGSLTTGWLIGWPTIVEFSIVWILIVARLPVSFRNMPLALLPRIDCTSPWMSIKRRAAQVGPEVLAQAGQEVGVCQLDRPARRERAGA